MTVEEANHAAEAINQLLRNGEGSQALTSAVLLRDRLRENVGAMPELLPHLQHTEQAVTQLRAAGLPAPSSTSAPFHTVPSVAPASDNNSESGAAVIAKIVCAIAMWFLYMGVSEYYGGSQTRAAVQGTVLESNAGWNQVAANYMSTGTTKVVIGLVLLAIGACVGTAGDSPEVKRAFKTTATSQPNPGHTAAALFFTVLVIMGWIATLL